MTPPEICPQCGAEVPPKARACPECGSDEETGWSEEARYQQLGVPTEAFDYDEFVRDEFGEQEPPPARPRGISFFWWIIAILVLLAFLSLYF